MTYTPLHQPLIVDSPSKYLSLYFFRVTEELLARGVRESSIVEIKGHIWNFEELSGVGYGCTNVLLIGQYTDGYLIPGSYEGNSLLLENPADTAHTAYPKS